MIKQYRENRNNLTPLLISIFIMFIPFFISFTLINNTSYLLYLVAIAYIFKVVIIGKKYMSSKISIKFLPIFTLYLILQMTTIQSNIILGLDTHMNDYINFIAKSINYYLLFGVMLNITVTENSVRQFMKGVVIFAIVASIYNLAINFDSILNVSNITSSYQVNFKSFFPNRNQFGMLLFISIVALNYDSSFLKHKVLEHGIKILFIINLFMTMSRGAIIATAIFYVLVYIRKLRNPRIFIRVMLFLFAIYIIIFFNSSLQSFIISNIIRADSGLAGRVDLWIMGLDIYKENNVISGVGFFTGISLAQTKGFQFDQFHSFFIDVLVSGGVFELFFIVLTVYYSYKRCNKHCSNIHYKNIFKCSLFAVAALSFVESVSLFSIGFVDTIYTIFFITIPVLLSNLKKSSEMEKH